jgi:hypothetical protein
MACVNQTRPHYVNQMGKTQSNYLAERHGRGTAWEQHGNRMVCVNPPLMCCCVAVSKNESIVLFVLTLFIWNVYVFVAGMVHLLQV